MQSAAPLRMSLLLARSADKAPLRQIDESCEHDRDKARQGTGLTRSMHTAAWPASAVLGDYFPTVTMQPVAFVVTAIVPLPSVPNTVAPILCRAAIVSWCGCP